PPRTSPPPVVLDAHEIAHDLARQMARRDASLGRRIYGELNWRKLRSEERAAFRTMDGVYACSAADEARILSDVPSARTAVIPNAADVRSYRPRWPDRPSDGRAIFFLRLVSPHSSHYGVRF